MERSADPMFCGPIDFDMNRDWPCKRLARVYHLRQLQRSAIERYRDGLPRGEHVANVRGGNLRQAGSRIAETRLARSRGDLSSDVHVRAR